MASKYCNYVPPRKKRVKKRLKEKKRVTLIETQLNKQMEKKEKNVRKKNYL